MTQNFHGLKRIDARQTIRQVEVKLMGKVDCSNLAATTGIPISKEYPTTGV